MHLVKRSSQNDYLGGRHLSSHDPTRDPAETIRPPPAAVSIAREQRREAAMTSVDTDGSGGRATRLRRRLREADFARIGFLGVLSIPGYLFESLAVMQWFALFFLAFFWVWIEPIVDHLLKRGADEESEPTDWIHMGDTREWVVAYLSILLVFLNPLVALQDLFQMVGSAVAYVRHRGSLPTPGDGRQPTYRLPVSGTGPSSTAASRRTTLTRGSRQPSVTLTTWLSPTMTAARVPRARAPRPITTTAMTKPSSRRPAASSWTPSTPTSSPPGAGAFPTR